MYNSVSELIQELEMLNKLKLEDPQNEIRKGIESGKILPLDIENVIERGLY